MNRFLHRASLYYTKYTFTERQVAKHQIQVYKNRVDTTATANQWLWTCKTFMPLVSIHYFSWYKRSIKITGRIFLEVQGVEKCYI